MSFKISTVGVLSERFTFFPPCNPKLIRRIIYGSVKNELMQFLDYRKKRTI